MKKYVFAALILFWAVNVFATGSCVVSSKEDIRLLGSENIERRYIALTCTGDGTITAFSFNPVTYGVRGWYLYNITTDPDGTSAPTALYDITLVVDGEDVAGGLLADRSATATETVVIAPGSKGYHMMDQTMAITFANETANPSVIALKLRFTRN